MHQNEVVKFSKKYYGLGLKKISFLRNSSDVNTLRT